MKNFSEKILISVMAFIFIFGSFEICSANSYVNLYRAFRAASTAKWISRAKTAADGADLLKMAAAFVVSNTSEFEIADVLPGSPMEDIRKKLQMKFNQKVHADNHDEWHYYDSTLVVTEKNGIADSIFCANKDLSTNRGIKVGASLQNVINTYGSNYKVVPFNDYCDVYVFYVKIEGNIIDRVSNLFSHEVKMGQIFFFIDKKSSQVLGFMTAIISA